jgi:predicted MFS family arabinose efflux permease
VTAGRILRAPWLVRDARLIIATRALRTFGYGCTSVLLADMLIRRGFSAPQVGGLLAVAAVGCVTASVLIGLFADRFGRRRSLLLTSALMAAAGVTFAVSGSFPVLLLAAFIGTISPSTNDNTPFSGVEQAVLAQTCAFRHHPKLYTYYNSTALLAGAAGGLAAAALGALAGPDAGRYAFVLYAVLAVAIGVVFLRLSPRAEALEVRREPVPGANGTRARVPLSGPIRRLSALFAVDAFAGGLAVQAILALWFEQRYGVTATQLGLLFFAANLLPAIAQLAAPALAARGGLLATMLLPHAFANLLLLSVPFAPTFAVAALLLLLRQTLSKIDVPARQAFVAAVVDPADRTAAASFTMVSRSVAVSVSPMASTLLLSGALAAVGAPLLLGAGLGIGYDAAMWRSFRTTRLATDDDPGEPATHPHQTARITGATTK